MILPAPAVYETIMANSALRTSFAIYHLIYTRARGMILLINFVLRLRETVADLSYATKVEDGFFVVL